MPFWLRQNPGQRAYYVGLNDRSSPAECVALIGRSLGHDNLDGLPQLLPLLREGLYYLDNLESLDSPEGNALLRELAQQPRVRLLASSRVKIPALGKPVEIEQLPLAAALRTFAEAWNGADSVLDDPALPVFVERDPGCHALSVVLTAGLGDVYALPRLIEQWRQKGTYIAQQENDPTRRGSLQVSLHLSSDTLAERQPEALLLWSVAALFPDGLDANALRLLEQNKTVGTGEIPALVRHGLLRRSGDIYRMLPPVARFALDEAHRESGGFAWQAAKTAVLPLFLVMAQAADSIASTDAALNARAVLLQYFSAVRRFLLEECLEASPDLRLLGAFHGMLRNQYQFNITLGKEILEAVQPLLSGSEKDQRNHASALKALGDLESRLGNVERARQLYDQAIELYRKEQDPMGLGYAAAETLRCLHALGRPAAELEKTARFALQMAQASGGEGVLRYVVQALIEVGLVDPADLKPPA